MSNAGDWLKLQSAYAFLEVYGVDGYDHRKKILVSAKGKEVICHLEDEHAKIEFSFGLALCSFVGLPSRINKVETSSDCNPVHTLHFDGWQLIRNLFGGWEPIKNWNTKTWSSKQIWQFVALPVKIFLIFPWKLISLPIKLLINTLKLFTEFLPAMGVNLLGPPLSRFWNSVRTIAKDSSQGNSRWFNVVGYFFLVLLTLIPFLITLAIKYCGMSFTSPEKKARIAFKHGYNVARPLLELMSIDPRGRGGKIIRYILGGINAILSILTSAAIWLVAAPLVFGGIITFFPALLQPLSWFGQFPWITSTIATIENALAVIGLSTAAAYGAFISLFSVHLGIHVSTMVLIVGSAVGALAAPICSLLSHLADRLSNAWALWRDQTLSEQFTSPFLSTESATEPSDKVPLLRVSSSALETVEDFKNATIQALETDKKIPVPEHLPNERKNSKSTGIQASAEEDTGLHRSKSETDHAKPGTKPATEFYYF